MFVVGGTVHDGVVLSLFNWTNSFLTVAMPVCRQFNESWTWPRAFPLIPFTGFPFFLLGANLIALACSLSLTNKCYFIFFLTNLHLFSQFSCTQHSKCKSVALLLCQRTNAQSSILFILANLSSFSSCSSVK